LLSRIVNRKEGPAAGTAVERGSSVSEGAVVEVGLDVGLGGGTSVDLGIDVVVGGGAAVEVGLGVGLEGGTAVKVGDTVGPEVGVVPVLQAMVSAMAANNTPDINAFILIPSFSFYS
jgi:hypothetical protein